MHLCTPTPCKGLLAEQEAVPTATVPQQGPLRPMQEPPEMDVDMPEEQQQFLAPPLPQPGNAIDDGPDQPPLLPLGQNENAAVEAGAHNQELPLPLQESCESD